MDFDDFGRDDEQMEDELLWTPLDEDWRKQPPPMPPRLRILVIP